MVETRSGKMQDTSEERLKTEESAKPQPSATIGRDASADPVVLNPNIDIPKYDGTEDPRPWIESLEEIGFLYHWAEYIISRYAAMNMIGSAKTWLDLHKISFTSWEHFKSRLIQDFGSDANKEELKMRLNRMQQWNEPAIRASIEAEDGEYVIEENNRMTQTNGLRLARSLLTVTDKKTHIWITNPYPRPLKIMKDQTLAYGSLPAGVNFIENKEKQNENDEIQFQINKNLSFKEQERLKQILAKYTDLFSSRLGRTSLAKHQIHTEDAKPIKHKPYRVSAKERTIIKDQIDEMLEEGIIRQSSSPWSFPVILVKKRDGKYRFCVDYRKLNEVTVKDVYPIPRIDDVMDTLQGSKYFSAIDLKSGYWQVEIEERDKEKTAFTTAHGLYEFNVMPFGLCNAPATFERNMDNVLGNLRWQICLCYLDDVIIYSSDFPTHIKRLEAVLRCFSESNLKLNAKKCRFAFEELEILGHITNQEGIKPAEYNIKAVRDFPQPKKAKEVLSFLGMCSYYRKFIKDFSLIADPLTSLIRKNVQFIWTGKQEEAFQNLKKALMNPPILGHFDPNAATCIHTDASNIGLGATLIQNIGGEEKNFKEENGCLYKKNPNPEGREWLLVVPKKRRKEIMSEYHNHMLNGHLGVARTTYRLKNKYYWPSMLKDVSEFVKTCHLCQSRKGSNQLPSGLLQPIPPANYPFERIGIDFVGPLPSTKRRRKWIIVLTDYYTKYAETKAVPEATVKEVSTFLIEHIFLRHGAPRFLISDRGSQFTSNLMKEVMKMCKVKHCFTTSYHPQTNGLTERLNRTLINMISMYVNTDQKNWDEILPFITHAYNTTIQETTGYSPFFLLFGREPMSLLDDENIPTDSNMDDYDEYIENYLDKIARTRQVVINNTEKTQERMKRNYDKKHNERIYEPGHLVAVWTPVRKIGKCEKLLRKYFGPYRILKKLSNVNYLIEPKDNPGQDPLIVHVSRLKPYFERIDEAIIRKKTAMGLQLNLPTDIILESLTEGLPTADQRLVRTVSPNTLKDWHDLMARIKGSSVPAPARPTPEPTSSRHDGHITLAREQPSRPYNMPPRFFSTPRLHRHADSSAPSQPPSPCHYCRGNHWNAQCPRRQPSGRNNVFYQETTGRQPRTSPSTARSPPARSAPPSDTTVQTTPRSEEIGDSKLPFGILSLNTLSNFKLKIDLCNFLVFQNEAPLPPTMYHFSLVNDSCNYGKSLENSSKRANLATYQHNPSMHVSDTSRHGFSYMSPSHETISNCDFASPKKHVDMPQNNVFNHCIPNYTTNVCQIPASQSCSNSNIPSSFLDIINRYSHIFSSNKFDVPKLKIPPVKIHTISDKIIALRPYRASLVDQREIQEQVNQMLKFGIIEPSFSPYASPVTLVTKKDKTKRFCVDFRKLNEIICPDVHPLPLIETVLDKLAHAKIFTNVDISSAFWQVEIEPSSRNLLAFVTLEGQYQFSRLPFGLRNSPQIYERALSQVIQKYELDFIAHYFDDFVIFSNTIEEHAQHIQKFFLVCQEENIKLNYNKCEFFKTQIEFLGYTIKSGTYTPQIKNLDVINAIKVPTNLKTLQSFLGAINVYNKFIPNYAQLRTPLNKLLKKDTTWDWDNQCQTSFEALKESLTSQPILHLFKEGLPCQLYCDASLLGIAGVLKQQYPDGTLYPVQFYSRALRPHEKNYTISELECLAIIECVDKFRVYLTGVKFTIFTDHHALQWLKTIKNPTGRLFRWSLKMSTYEYEIRYIKGSKQHEADLLSRNPFCGFLSAAQIKEKQPLELPYPNATINPEGLHTLTRKGVTKVIVPPSLQHTLINKVHVEYNHPGVSQMTRIISTQYTWRGMTHSIAKYVKSCPTCQLIKRPKGPNYGTLGQLPLVSHPFDTLSIDTIAGFSKYGSSKTYLHVIVDHLSRYAWTFPSKSTSTLTYLQCLKKVMQSNTPKCLLSDRAPAFTSPKFRRFLLRHGIQPLLTTSNNPQANGLCERLNATLTGKLRILHLENPKVSWIKLIKTVTDKYNQTPHTVTGFPPSFLMYNIVPTELSSHIDPYPPVEEARKIAIKRTLDRHAKEKIKYDSKHRTPQFEVGDIFLVKVYHHPNSGKLLPYFTGPYTILEIISPNVVRINRANQPLNRDNDTVHVNKLKYYTEEVLYIAPPQKYSLPNKNNRKPTNLSPYNHFPPDLFDNSTNRHIPPRSNFNNLQIYQNNDALPTNVYKFTKCKQDLCPTQPRETDIFTTFPSNQSCLHVADPTPIICSPTIVSPTISPTHDIEISIPSNATPQLEHCPHELHRILYEFSHVFSTNKYNVPKLNIPPVKINTTTDKIIALRPYRVPLHDQQEIQTQIEQMLQHGIIAPSVSPYASPITLVTKRDKTKRFCIDYRKLNEIIAPDVHPLPLIETILDKLSKAKYYSSVDIASAYWQVEVEPNSRTYAPQTRNLDTISAIKPPTNQKTLQSFLGAVNVYNKFIPDYARLRAPLNKLLKKDVKWNWDPDCQQAFTTLKESLTSKPVLHLYQVGLSCRLYCDASTQGIAGILKQLHPDGQVHPVQYFSRALRAHERNYTVSELECLAIVESVDKFRIYLTGIKFTIYTDHQALQWLKTIKNPSGRLFRWSLRLSTYNYEIHYLKGSQQYEADLLSRNPFVGYVSADIIKQHQPTASPFNIDTNGLHTITRKGVIKIIIPETLQHTLMNKVHQEYNHPGISQMTRIITAQYYWKGISKSIEKFVKSCHTCQIIKRPKGKPYGALGQIPPPQQPFDLISIDTIAGFSKYGHSKTYLHVIVDHLTRYAWTFPSKSTSTLTNIQTLKTVLQQGSPKRLLSDRAPAFTSEKFRKFLITHGIQPLLTTSNNPQANGLIERLNATITGKLRLAYLENPKASWTQLVKRVTQTYNNTPHSVTSFPPTYLMFNVIPPDLRTHLDPYSEINIAREIANSRTQNKHKKDKEIFDKQHRTPHFEVNDLVLVKNYRHPDTGKLAPYFSGPYKIIEIISPNVVRIDRPNQPLNRDSDTIHVNKLKYYTENVLYITPPQTRFAQTPQRLSQDLSCKQRLVEGKTSSYPASSVLWKERRQAILQAASCGRKDVKLSCKQRLVDGENALEYPSSSNLRAEKTLRQPTSRDNWTSHKTSQAKPATVLPR
ncbi:hypothetical protein LAZ67_5000530, partial [Cordylochernes scorpioides]